MVEQKKPKQLKVLKPPPKMKTLDDGEKKPGELQALRALVAYRGFIGKKLLNWTWREKNEERPLSNNLKEQRIYYLRRRREIAHILSKPEVVVALGLFIETETNGLPSNVERAGLTVIYAAKKYCNLEVVAHSQEGEASV